MNRSEIFEWAVASPDGLDEFDGNGEFASPQAAFDYVFRVLGDMQAQGETIDSRYFVTVRPKAGSPAKRTWVGN